MRTDRHEKGIICYTVVSSQAIFQMIQNPQFNPYGMPYIKVAIILAFIEYARGYN